MDYKLSKKWFLSIYGKQNLDTRRYRGLSSEAIPTTLGSDIVLKVGKGWKLKTGEQYQYNNIKVLENKKSYFPFILVPL